jgi:protein gp37
MSAIYPFGFEPTFLPHRLIAPKNTKPFSPDMIRAKANQRNLPLEYANQFAKNVFVCSMADLFGDWTPTEWIKQVFDQVTTHTQWNYLFLTKFPQRLKSIQDELLGGKFPDNCWVGTTVDEQKRVKIAQKAFEGINAKVKWLSLEPLLTNLEFDNLGMFDMVAIGGQSGNSQCKPQQPEWEWVENIIFQAHQSKTMIYFKENLTIRPKKLPIN